MGAGGRRPVSGRGRGLSGQHPATGGRVLVAHLVGRQPDSATTLTGHEVGHRSGLGRSHRRSFPRLPGHEAQPAHGFRRRGGARPLKRRRSEAGHSAPQGFFATRYQSTSPPCSPAAPHRAPCGAVPPSVRFPDIPLGTRSTPKRSRRSRFLGVHSGSAGASHNRPCG